jgi:hypothetical protein
MNKKKLKTTKMKNVVDKDPWVKDFALLEIHLESVTDLRGFRRI